MVIIIIIPPAGTLRFAQLKRQKRITQKIEVQINMLKMYPFIQNII